VRRGKPIRIVKAKMEGIKESRDRIPDRVLREIFPKRFNRSLVSKRVYSHLKQMILSGKVKKGKRLIQEKIAQKFSVSRMTVGIAFSKLKKDGLITSKRGVGSFIV
jgi:DNA-binding GntR family transcriptional regulator